MNINKPYIIAEMACSHEGDISLAKKIIDSAGIAKANAIQFQIWTAEDIMVSHSPDFKKLKKIELNREDWTNLYNYTREKWPKLSLIACVYDEESIKFSENLGVDAYKIHASDITNPKILSSVASTNKRIDLSIGASTISEIDSAIKIIRFTSNSSIWLMYGYQLFPTPAKNLNLEYMNKISNLYGLTVGYQDHCDANKMEAFWLPAAVYGMGINVIEKHLTHDRSLKGLDHESALNPSEFKDFVDMIHTIDLSRGSGFPRKLNEDEENYRKYSRKSLVAKHDLIKGKKIDHSDLMALRGPKLGISPDLVSI
ncbi:MAG: N,N'-diacetyllegionaminic acid synthase, partial [Alphaproteobacteria bacterium MarineAlpha2_Bin1]